MSGSAGEFEVGTILRRKYRVERLMGKGGMGFVLEATHLDLEQRVAIKLLHPELRVHPELVERFLREGRAASRLRSDHIARVLDVDRLEDGTPLLVMEYLEGADLSSVRRSRTPLSIRDATDYVLQAAGAIAEAHDKHIIHRDLKPANLFLARLENGTTKVKVLDFGISKLSNPLGGSEPSVTSTSMVLGSGEYMSPEQMLSAKDVDLRTDLWALGVVLFELLTARVPFPGDSLTQVCAMVMSQPAPRLRSLRPDAPEALEAVVSRCLEKDREQRFATVRDFMRELQASLSATAVGLGPPSTSPLPDLGKEAQHSPVPVVFGAPAAADANFSPSGTSILPTTPVPLRPEDGGPATPLLNAPAAGGPRSATPWESAQQSDVVATKASDAPPPLRAMAAAPSSGASSSTSVSGHGFPTNAAVSSDPIPAPPMKRSRGLLFAVGAAVVLAAGIAIANFLPSRASQSRAGALSVSESATASTPPAPATSDASSPDVVSVAASESAPLAVTPAPSTAPSAAVATTPATAGASPHDAARPQTPAPSTTGTKPTTSKPAGRPAPAKTSGID